MKELKQRMIQEINSYIRKTGDYDLDYFISKEIVNYMEQHNVELIWYPVLWEDKYTISEIAIDSM